MDVAISLALVEHTWQLAPNTMYYDILSAWVKLVNVNTITRQAPTEHRLSTDKQYAASQLPQSGLHPDITEQSERLVIHWNLLCIGSNFDDL